MQIGIGLSGSRLERLVADARQAEAEGFEFCTMPNIFSHEAITTLALAGAQTERIRLVTAIVPTYPRHPMTMAQQALTAQAASRGRFTLGVGLSHQRVIEGMYGLSYDRPAVHMREYLEVLLPLLRGEPVDHQGEQFTFRGQIPTRDADPVPCVIAAMAPVMLRLAGEQTDGTILWMTGEPAVRTHVAPRITRAAEAAGRPAPAIYCGLPMTLTNDEQAARAKASELFANYGTLPSYRAMLDQAGADQPGDVAVVGDEASLRGQLKALRDSGVTHFYAAPFDDGAGSIPRTREFLASVLSDYA